MNRNEINLQSVNAYGILNELKKHWKLIIVFTLSVWLFLTGIGSLSYTPEFTVSTTLVVTDKQSDNNYASLTMASSMADVMAEIFQSDAMYSLVENDTDVHLDGTITCSQVPETNLIVLNIISSDPGNAYTFMNSALTHYSEVSGHVFSNASLQILQEPSIPTSPSNKPWLSNHKNLVTLFAGLGICALISFLYISRYTLKLSSNAKSVLDGNVLGVIPYEKKTERGVKKSLLITLPVISMAYSEAYRKVATRIEHTLRRKGQKVLLVTSVAENEGKSTCAANIALALQEKGKKVLLIDCDFMKPSQFKVFERKMGSNKVYETIQYNERTHIWELFLSKPLKSQFFRISENLQKIIDANRSHFDYILIDSSPTKASSDAESLMDIADSTILVVRQDWADIRIINDTVDLIWQSNSDFLGFVLNSFDEKSSHHDAYGYGHYTHSLKEGR